MFSKKQFGTLFSAGLLLSFSAQAQTAKVQIIHNCADAAADSADIYVNGVQALDNVAFRTATAFIDLPAGVPLAIGVAPKTSTSVSDTIYNLNATLAANGKYLAVAQGIVSPTGYSPAPPFKINVSALGQTQAAAPGNTDVMIVHGSTDAPTVDVRSGITTLANNLSFGDFNTGYLALPTADYKVRITTPTGSATVATFSAPLATLNLQDSALVVLASGFLNPSNNSNGPAFGLWVALPTGGSLIPLPASAPENLARAQVIHNCADAAADSVDVYLNGSLLLNNFAFRTATNFVDLPGSAPLTIGIASKNSTSVADTIFSQTVTLDSAGRYIVTANGIVSPTGYNPNKPFGLSIFAGAREVAATSTTTDLLILHGSTDATIVDVRSGGSVLVNNIGYGSYDGYLSLPVNNYTISITDSSGVTTVASYSAPLQTLSLGGAALTVLASGFLTPGTNSNGPAFGLWVASPAGGALIQLPTATNVADIESSSKATIAVVPNPISGRFYVSGLRSKAEANILDMNGRVLWSGSVQAGESVDVSSLASGCYLLQVVENKTVSRLKLAIK